MSSFTLDPIPCYIHEVSIVTKMNVIKSSITLQVLDDKERYFLDLLDDDLKSIEPTYSKE